MMRYAKKFQSIFECPYFSKKFSDREKAKQEQTIFLLRKIELFSLTNLLEFHIGTDSDDIS